MKAVCPLCKDPWNGRVKLVKTVDVAVDESGRGFLVWQFVCLNCVINFVVVSRTRTFNGR